MTDSNITRIAVALYSILAGTCVFFLWKNSSAPDAVKNSGILIASILPVLLSVLPYWHAERISNQLTFALFYDSKSKNFITGEMNNPYEKSYCMHMFVNADKAIDALTISNVGELDGPKGLDIIEKGILDNMMLKFGTYWNVTPVENIGPVFSSKGSMIGEDIGGVGIANKEIRSIFKHNHLMSAEDTLVYRQLVLPPASTISLTQSSALRSVSIKNPKMTTVITIQVAGFSVAQHGVSGMFEPDPSDMNRYYGVQYLVSIVSTINRFETYSPNISLYKQYHSNIVDGLSEFDWKTINKRIEESLWKKAVEKLSRK